MLHKIQSISNKRPPAQNRRILKMKKIFIILAFVSLIMTIRVNSFAQFSDPEILMYELQMEQEMKQAEKEAAEESAKIQEMYHRYNKISKQSVLSQDGHEPTLQELINWTNRIILFRKEVIELCESKPSYKMFLWSMKLELDDRCTEINSIRTTEIELAKLEFDELIDTMNNINKNTTSNI